MKRIAVILLCVMTLALLPACNSSDDDNGSGGGGNTPATDLSGHWVGGGTFTDDANGGTTSQHYDLTLDLIHVGGQVGGSFHFARPGVGLTRDGNINGTASGGAIHIDMPCCWEMTGSYGENSMAVTLTESFSTGSVDWIRGNGSLSR